MDWNDLLRDPPWWLQTCVAFGAVLAGIAAIRSVVYIYQFGFLNFLRATFRPEPHTWMIIGILMFVAVASMAAFVVPYGAPWRLVR